MRKSSTLNGPIRNGLCFILLLAAQFSGCGGGGGGATTPGVQTFQMGGAMQGVALDLIPRVSTLAGAAVGSDGAGLASRFGQPGAIASDGANLYVADSNIHKIRKIVIATGVVTTLAGTGAVGAADGAGASATFNYPSGIATDGTNLYVSDTVNQKIRKIVIATGVVSSMTGVADTAASGGAADGAGSGASFNYPRGITTDGTSLFVADSGNSKIRQIDIASGAVSSLTGSANTMEASGAKDGAVASATFSSLEGITYHGGSLYVADSGNHKIRKIVLGTSQVGSVTGLTDTANLAGAKDGGATVAKFYYPTGIATDGTNLFVADKNNNKIRVVAIVSGSASSLTGTTDTTDLAGMADGSGAAATFFEPQGIVCVGSKLYVADTSNSIIRSVALATGEVVTIAGNAFPVADGTGGAATFSSPSGITTDGANLYVIDVMHHNIRKIVIATGVVTTLAGTGSPGAADGAGPSASFNFPAAITTDGTNLYVTDSSNNKIRKIVIATGMVSSLTGTADTAAGPGATDGGGATALFDGPTGITTDGTNLYVADTANRKIRKVVISSGAVSSLTGVAHTPGAYGAKDGVGTSATFNLPQGITTDGKMLYVADTFNNKIRTVDIVSGMVGSLTGVADTKTTAGAADGEGVSASFDRPYAVTSDGTNLYVADTANHKVRKIVIGTGVVSSLNGAANATGPAGSADGAAADARFSGPAGITSNGSRIFVTDSDNRTIRAIQ